MFKEIKYIKTRNTIYSEFFKIIDDDFVEMFYTVNGISDFFNVISFYIGKEYSVGKNIFLFVKFLDETSLYDWKTEHIIDYTKQHPMYESFREDFEKYLALV